MRNANGYGSIYKRKERLRKPYEVKVTLRIYLTEDGKMKQERKVLGYYATSAEAREALANYNKNPYSIDGAKATFAEIYDKWSDEKFETISKSNINGYRASYKCCEKLYNKKFVDIRKADLQEIVDHCGKAYPTLRKLKVLFNQMYRFALENDICSKDYSQFVNIAKHKTDPADSEKLHKPFSKAEIQKLWDNSGNNEYIHTILMLIYSGVRISELLNLKKTDINLEEHYFDITKSKTDSGIRRVPIADKTYNYFVNWYNRSVGSNLIETHDGKPMTYRNYVDSYWNPIMEELSMEHKCHDTRHTCVSMLVAADVNQTIIKKIVGHSGAMTLTERVYTKLDIKELLDAVNSI